MGKPSSTAQLAYNGDGVRTSKTVAGDSTEYALDLLATLPVVISDTEAASLCGLAVSPPPPPVLPMVRSARLGAF